MCQLNNIGEKLSQIDGVKALTDVTGFGLVGHLSEICLGSGVKAQIDFAKLPLLKQVEHYRAQGCIPGGTERNFESYSELLEPLSDQQKHIVCDPQTSGGLLVAVEFDASNDVEALLASNGLHALPIGQLVDNDSQDAVIRVV